MIGQPGQAEIISISTDPAPEAEIPLGIGLPVGADDSTTPATPTLPTLSEAEQDQLDALLAVQKPEILSELSPDGTTLVVALANRLDPSNRRLHFLDITTGELSEALVLQYEVINPDLPLRWLNNDTLRFVQQDVFGPWEILSINRTTGIVSRTQIYPTAEESGEILGLSPDFSKLVIRVYEAEEDAIYVVFLASLQRMELARLPKDLAIQTPTWSESSDQVALVTSAIAERRLYDRTPTSPGFASPVVQDALGRLATTESLFRQQNTVRVFDFSQAEPLQFELTPETTGGDALAEASFSPNGQQILVKRYRPAAVAGRPHPTYLFPEAAYYEVYDLAGNPIETIDFPALQGPQESAGQFLGRHRLLFWATTATNRTLMVYDLRRRRLTPLPLPPGSVDPASVTTSEDGRTVIYSFSAVTQLPELFSLPTDGSGTPQALTQINDDLASLNQVQYNSVSFTTRNGVRQGFLVQPADSAFPPRQRPLVLWQQGGPGFSMANEFATEVEMPLNLLPNFGLAVLVVPLSGREGFGASFYRSQADQQNFGRIDIAEGQDIVNQLVQQGWTTAAQVGVTGCSYGGYYAAQIISQFPDLFAAANPQCSLLDTLTEWQLGYASLLSYLVGQTPMENPTTYLEISPLYNAAAIRTPTMMFHGADDFLQIDVARNFHDVIESAGVPVTLYQFEGTGHSLTNPDYQRIAAQLQVEFFRQYLQD